MSALWVRPGNRGFAPPHLIYKWASGFRSGFRRPAMWAQYIPFSEVGLIVYFTIKSYETQIVNTKIERVQNFFGENHDQQKN
jgi:hypothetical protein